MYGILTYTSYFKNDTPSTSAHVFSSVERAKEELLETIEWAEGKGGRLVWLSDDNRRARYDMLGERSKRVLYSVVLTVIPVEEIYD